jgi:cyclopropane-fatty-acyl-phospholipid synthase
MSQMLKRNGILVIQTMINNFSGKSYYLDPWMEKYIFPGAMIPTLQQVFESSSDKFILEDQ